MKILIAEDHPALRQLLASGLEAFGHEVVAASNGEEAVEIIKTSPDIDIALTDRCMPRPDDGFAVARFAKTRLPEIKVVMMTADADQSVRERAGAIGIDAVLEKPVAIEEINKLFHRLVGGR